MKSLCISSYAHLRLRQAVCLITTFTVTNTIVYHVNLESYYPIRTTLAPWLHERVQLGACNRHRSTCPPAAVPSCVYNLCCDIWSGCCVFDRIEIGTPHHRDTMTEDRWSNKGFSPLRMGIALILLEKSSDRTDIFFSYSQLAKPLNDCLATSDGTSGMAIIDENLINSAFQTPREASPYLSCSTIFDGIDGYEDYSQQYVIHIDKKNRKVACSKVTNSADLRSVGDDEANQLLLDLVLDDEVREKVKKFLRDKKSRGRKKKKKRPLSQNSTRAAAEATTNRGTTPSSGTHQPTVALSPPAHPQQKKQNTQPTPNKSGHGESQPILSAVSNDEHDTLLQQQQPSFLSRTPESIRKFLYDDNGKLSAEIEDLSDESPQQSNDFDCGIFTLLNLCLLVEEGSITKDSYSQASIYTKEVRNAFANILWNASSNRPEV